MTKETVRYPDAVVDRVEEVVEEGVFESKSEFYRFSAEFVLDRILADYDPETIDFEEIRADLREYGDADANDDGEDAFVEAVVRVRKHSLRDEFADAEDVIDRSYGDGDIESVILEELLAQYRRM